jgi:predicted amidohydrolase YtcJ
MMRAVSVAAVLTVLAPSCWAGEVADTVFHHGRIHTQNPRRDIVEAVALRGNRILATGSDAAIDALVGPRTRVVDLGGRIVLPGLIDAHTHPAESAGDIEKCTLDDKPLDTAGIEAVVAACLKANPGDRRQWFEVVQANPSGVTLTRQDLDHMLPDRPLLISGADGHTAWINSKAMAASGITAATRDPDGGRIERDPAGLPTGTLRDNATELAFGHMPGPGLQREADLTAKALAEMNATGLTQVQDASVDDHLMQIYKRLYDQHRLTMRVRACFHLQNLALPAETVVAEAEAFRAKWAINPDFLRADAVKIFADGVVEYPTQTAALLAPYLDRNGVPTNNVGPSYFQQDNLNRIVGAADAAGFSVHVHAIGDRAVRGALDAFAWARKLNGDQDNRDQIAHLELVDPADLPRFKALGVIANLQLQWAERDDYVARATLPYIGEARSQHIYPARSLRDAGALIAGGSDWNVSTFDPFEAIEHAITRREFKGAPPLDPDEAVTLQDMIDAYTINAASALNAEHNSGSLEPGKLADLVVLDRDIYAVDPADLHETKVLATWLDGKPVFTAPGFAEG